MKARHLHRWVSFFTLNYKRGGRCKCDMKKLTVKQKRFADNYIETGNARQSAISAGYSERTASVIASENLTKPNILAYIDKQLKGHDFDVEIRQRQALNYALG